MKPGKWPHAQLQLHSNCWMMTPRMHPAYIPGTYLKLQWTPPECSFGESFMRRFRIHNVPPTLCQHVECKVPLRCSPAKGWSGSLHRIKAPSPVSECGCRWAVASTVKWQDVLTLPTSVNKCFQSLRRSRARWWQKGKSKLGVLGKKSAHY